MSEKPNIPKDYADKSGLLDNDDWEYKNKEDFPTLARYFTYILAAGAVAFIIGTLISDWVK